MLPNESWYGYLGLHKINGVEAVIYLGIVAAVSVLYVLWHARNRLKMRKETVRDAEWP